jgi:hypothetical protein
MPVGKKMPTLSDYQNPQKDFVLPDIPADILQALGKPNKPVILKRCIIEKVKKDHPEIHLAEYNNIINNALYRTSAVLQSNFKNKPEYFNFVRRSNKNDVAVLEMTERKHNFEIVTFLKTRQRDFARMYRNTSRDGGQIIVTNR